MSRNVVVVVEHHEGKLRPVTRDLMACASILRRLLSGRITAVILGRDIAGLAHETAGMYGVSVLGIENPALRDYNGEHWKSALKGVLADLAPSYVCVGHTLEGMEFAPGLSVTLGAACVTGIEHVGGDPSRVLLTRSIHGGKLLAEVTPCVETTVLTVQPGSFSGFPFGANAPGAVELRSVSIPPSSSRTVGIKRSKDRNTALADADVIVAAGKGIGKRENIELVKRLAALFPKSAVAGSRWVVDAGWMEHKQQVGLTGATVKPKLYIACGISGASQHIVGMRESEFVVAINKDPYAAIFKFADVCIVEDLTSFIPVLIDRYEKQVRNECIPTAS
ncbi:MAG: electron transfer flavoprotein subunit alpha/FixB family protein [Deltaproteobacteria bacterium]|nr:electron transfer flavoprotein subunit alpha/FixB family protein [Deltaproteobacteria bacterium]